MKKKYWYKPEGYETDHLIHDLTDEQLLAHMGVPRRYIGFAVARAKEVFPEEVEVWMENLPYIFRPSDEAMAVKMDIVGKGLILTGPGGTRKTTMAAAILLKVIRKEIHNTDPTGRNFTWHGAAMGRFVDWQEASELFRTANDPEEEGAATREIRTAMVPSGPMLTRADFLVLDDISREKATEYNAGELQRILRRRGDEGYPTILTTNYAEDEWAKSHGDVLAGYLSRSNIIVECTG